MALALSCKYLSFDCIIPCIFSSVLLMQKCSTLDFSNDFAFSKLWTNFLVIRISKKDVMTGEIKHYNVNACLMPVLAADGCHVTTVEGVGTVKGDKMHPIQKAMTELHGSQCGFCTPGIIVSIYSLYANRASMKEIEEHLDGNLCRCTGYRPIWDAARSLCDDAEHLVHGPCGTPCRECPERNECEQDCNVQDKQEEAEKDKVVCSTTKDKVAMKDLFVAGKTDWLEQPDQLFPKELVDSSSSESMDLAKPLMVVDKTEFQGAGTWFKPSSLEDLLLLLKDFGDPAGGGYKIVVGNTEVGIGTFQRILKLSLALSMNESLINPDAIFLSMSRDKVQTCCLSSLDLPK